MIEHKYTAQDARREVRECFEEGYGFDFVRIFLNDLTRGGDITWEENRVIMLEIFDGKYGNVDCSFGTL